LARFHGRPAVAVRLDPAEALLSRDSRLAGSREELETLRIEVDPMESGLFLLDAVRAAMGRLIARACEGADPEARVGTADMADFRFRSSVPTECVDFLGMRVGHDSARD